MKEAQDGFVTLPHLEAAMGEVRTRKQVDGLRLYVDEETKTLTLTIISNGEVRLTVEQ